MKNYLFLFLSVFLISAQSKAAICSDGFRQVIAQNKTIVLNGFDWQGMPTGSTFDCMDLDSGVVGVIAQGRHTCFKRGNRAVGFTFYSTRVAGIISLQIQDNTTGAMIFNGMCM